MSSGRTVLLAVNASEHSLRAFDWYVEKLRMPGDQLLITHVVGSPQIPAPTLAHGPTRTRDEWDHMMKKLEEEAKKITTRYEERCEAIQLPHKAVWAVGNIGDAICEMSRNEKAEMIVIGNRGLGSIRRTLLGSTTDHIVQHSDVPIVVVPPRH